MAIINSIRKRSGLAVLVISLAIAAFILTDLFGKLVQGGGPESMKVGSIQGESISYNDFNQRVSMMEAQFAGRGLNAQQRVQLREQVWNDYIFEKVYKPQYDVLGLTVTPREIREILQGDSIMRDPQSQVMRQLMPSFRDSTGKYDKGKIGVFWERAPNNQKDPIRQGLRRERLQKKYSSLLEFSTYVTQAEAKRDYVNKNTKGDFKFLYVPYTSVPDSTVEVTDADLEGYMRDHADEYKSQETRTLEYYVLPIDPSPEDSTKFASNIREIAKSFAKAANDSLFASGRSDDAQPFTFQDPTKLPKEIWQTVPTLAKGAVVGPLNQKNTYTIYKVSDVKDDSVYYANTAHILFKADSTLKQSERDSIRNKANEILQKVLDNPSDFAKMAQTYGSDGTKDQGGELGWANLSKYVKEFKDAIIKAEKVGTIPNLVKTQFGYHIVKIIHPASKKLYKVATIKKTLLPGKSTLDAAFKTSDRLVNESKTLEELRANAKKNPKLIKNTADKIQPNATNLGSYQNAREIIRWAFKDDTKVGDIFNQPTELSDQNVYIIAALTGATEKDELNLEANRNALKIKVLQEKKKALIIQNLKKAKGESLEAIKKSYGALAQVRTLSAVTYDNSSVQGAGFNPTAVGYAFGTKKGQRSKPIGDQTGVFMFETTKITPAGEIKDYTKQQQELVNRTKNMSRFFIDQALRELADITDKRYKFY